MALVEREQLLKVLRAFNPWWHGQDVPHLPFRRVAFWQCRHYLEHATIDRAVLLNGPRRVGKTTLLKQMVHHLVHERGVNPGRVLYLSLDHPVIKLETAGSLIDLFHDEISTRGPDTYLLLDEVQYSRDWDLELKQLIDHGPGYRILATGSASLEHSSRLSHSGVGRWVRVAMPTLSFHEFVTLLGHGGAVPEPGHPRSLVHHSPAELASMAAAFRPLRPLMGHYLLAGGFPELARLADIPEGQRLLREDVVERVLKRDMGSLHGVRKLEHLERLFIYLCLHTGGQFSPEACARDLQSNRGTVISHLEALEAANLIYRLPPYRPGGKRVLRARDKVYLVDAAMRNAVLMRGMEVLDDPGECGLMMETAVYRHIHAAYYSETPVLGYWRDPKTGHEVDIVMGLLGKVRCIEVKYRSRAGVDPKGGLAAFLAREPDTVSAYQITREDEDFGVTRLEGIATPIMRIPAHIFLYAVGESERRLATGDAHGGL